MVAQNYRYLYISKEDYDRFPKILQSKLDKLAFRFKDIFKTNSLDSHMEKECLVVVRDFLNLALKNLKYMNKKIISSFSHFVIVEELHDKLSDEVYDIFIGLADVDLPKTEPKKFITKKVIEIENLLKKIK